MHPFHATFLSEFGAIASGASAAGAQSAPAQQFSVRKSTSPRIAPKSAT
jgi:hypothetical protein